MGKLTVITTVDKKTEVNQLIDELKKIVNDKIDKGEDGQDDPLTLVAEVIRNWIVESMIMAAGLDEVEDGGDADGTNH